MTIKIIASWPMLFSYARAEGKARLAMIDNPTEENRSRLDEAIKTHNSYRDVCLEADEMIGLSI